MASKKDDKMLVVVHLPVCEVGVDGEAVDTGVGAGNAGTVIAVDTGSVDTEVGAADTAGTVVTVDNESLDSGGTVSALDIGGTNARSVTADAINSSSVKTSLLNGKMPLTAKPDWIFTGVAALGSASAAIPGIS
jgi:hypothetical protein